MRILITGANGLVGKNIAKVLIATNQVEVFATSLKKFQLEGATTFTSNLLNADINHMVDDIRPETVVHCAALSSPDACEVDRYACHRMNVGLTKRIVSACVNYNVHLVFLSTDFIFDGAKDNYTELDMPNPVNYYGESKVEAEKLIQASGVVNTIVRTSLVYGVETKLSRPNILTRVIDNLRKNKQYKVPSDQIRTPTYAPDLASAISQICLNRVTGIYNISGDRIISVADFAILAAKAFNLNHELLLPVNSNDLAEAAPRPKTTPLDISKAKNDLNFTPTPIEMALEKIKIALNS
ncbi:MAG TPA: SDR family oxidoreductase [Bacteroidales bacterium]|nr:SDR family oxidoreductase [Bacteroidales bacterium]